MKPGPCILVVDDEALIRWSLHERLVDAGYEVIEAASAAEALAVCCDRPALVVLDLRLPDGDGLGLLHRLREKCPTCRAIVMTAFGGPETARRARAAGVYRVVDKPFDIDAMVSLVRAALAAPPATTPGAAGGAAASQPAR